MRLFASSLSDLSNFKNSTLGQAWVIVPMALVTSVAAIFIRKAWIQYVALAVQVGGWILYFTFLQSALSG